MKPRGLKRYRREEVSNVLQDAEAFADVGSPSKLRKVAVEEGWDEGRGGRRVEEQPAWTACSSGNLEEKEKKEPPSEQSQKQSGEEDIRN